MTVKSEESSGTTLKDEVPHQVLYPQDLTWVPSIGSKRIGMQIQIKNQVFWTLGNRLGNKVEVHIGSKGEVSKEG